MTSALCAVLKELLEDSALQDRVLPRDRMFIYNVVRHAMSALGPPVLATLATAILKCAWAEFYVDSRDQDHAPVHPATKKARKKLTSLEIEMHQQSDAVAEAEFAQRPAAVEDVANAQVQSVAGISVFI
jgi:hypothetical protein